MYTCFVWSLKEKYIFVDDDKMYDKEMVLRICKQPIIGGMKPCCVGGDRIIYWVYLNVLAWHIGSRCESVLRTNSLS